MRTAINAMLMRPNKAETAVHGCHCPGDMAVRLFIVVLQYDSDLATSESSRDDHLLMYDDWMQETTQRTIKLLGLLLPDLLVKKCSYQS